MSGPEHLGVGDGLVLGPAEIEALNRARAALQAAGARVCCDGHLAQELFRRGCEMVAQQSTLPAPERRVGDLTVAELSRALGTADLEAARQANREARQKAEASLAAAQQSFADQQGVRAVGQTVRIANGDDWRALAEQIGGLVAGTRPGQVYLMQWAVVDTSGVAAAPPLIAYPPRTGGGGVN